ncbi:MAG: Asp-tRNA(Asn)/Glu-tRNA(Gln) amidotransferase subunit GatA [bacterium]|nr:Asp-tRNA(Asn)/Glu-tRNA(Gln) amidotransferase subunit GatA [bacterium]
MNDLGMLTIRHARELLAGGELSALELTEACLKEVEKKNGELNAYLEVFDDARAAAKEADRKLKTRTAGPLAGIPLALKDNILSKGKVASAASKILSGYRATYDATAVKLLKEAGAIVLGRTNMDEFAMGSSTVNSAFGVTKNPHDPARVAGGSSGGSAAAVAMGGALGALGSDTGGSIRQPAAFCGVVGMKPTYGMVSRFGLMAMGSSLDQIGPFAKTVEDAETIFDVIARHDSFDSTSLPDAMRARAGGKTKAIGVPKAFVESEGVDKGTLSNFKESLGRLEAKGFSIKEIELPHARYALAAYYIIMPAEVSANLARYDGVRYGERVKGGDLLATYMKTRGEGFGKETRRRILLGTYVLSAGYYDAYYGKAMGARGRIKRDFEEAFRHVDAIATPTTPSPAFMIGEKAKDPLSMYLEDIFTVPANLAGLPALSVPSGKSAEGLPLSLQLIAPYRADRALFDIGKAFEER